MIKTAFKFLFVLFLPLAGIAQDANQTITELLNKMNTVKDYSAEALITSDIPMVKILPSKATIYFKQKDKFKIETKGIAILPKQGFTELSKMLTNRDSYTAVALGNETIGSTQTSIVSIFPVSDTSDLILAKLWIDGTNDIVMKSQITTRSSGTVTILYTYGSQIKWGLPDKMVITVDVKKFKIPKGVATDINKKSEDDTKKQEAKTGEIKIDLTGYKVNLGIKDEVFNK
jgi:outer membrane lipoprotein-sorting protein